MFKKSDKKIYKNINKLEKMLNHKHSLLEQKIMKLKERFENRKKFKLVDYEKEIFTFAFKMISIITYIAVFITSIVAEELEAKYCILWYMVISTSLVFITLIAILIMRRFDK